MMVSVIIPCHGEAPLREQLLSLRAQDYTGPWEVLITDNGISTETHAVVEELAAHWPALSVVDATQRRGKSYAVNLAVGVARGTHLVLLDSDDVVNPGYLRHLSAAMEHHDFVGARLDSVTLNPAWVRARRKPLQETGLETLLDHRPVVIGAGMAMSKAAYLRVGGFDEDLLTQVDLDLSWRLHSAGFMPHFTPEAVVHYRYRQGVAAVFQQERRYGRGEVALYCKHRTDGLPPPRLRRVVRSWLDLALALPRFGTRAGRARIATTAGAISGRIEGSIRHRVLYL
jgi:cellulose synthase/poly-beta-1,6-N-acetylglucosamine synthase-like glycosyltransferase